MTPQKSASNRRAGQQARKDRLLKTEKLLQKSEAQKAAILHALRDIVDIRYLDCELRILWDNKTIGPNPAIMGDYCYSVIRGRSEPCRTGCTPIEALKDGLVKSKEKRLEDGRVFFERSYPVKDERDNVKGVVFITLNITEHKQIEANYQTTHRFLHSFLENLPTPITVFDKDGCVELINPAWDKLIGSKWNYAVGQPLEHIFPKHAARQIRQSNSEILQSGRPMEIEESVDFQKGRHYFHTVKFPLQDSSGHTVVGTISVDQTARKHAEQELRRRKEELRRKSHQLEEMNTALKVLLKQREKDQKELEKRLVMNIRELVLPYVHKLKKMHLNNNQASCLEILETHLADIVTPFLHHVISRHPRMTAREIQVATLVREGKTNKDIAEFMHLSVNTIQIHRHNLRKKLGLKNKKTNLRSYLLSLNLGDGQD